MQELYSIDRHLGNLLRLAEYRELISRDIPKRRANSIGDASLANHVFSVTKARCRYFCRYRLELHQKTKDTG